MVKNFRRCLLLAAVCLLALISAVPGAMAKSQDVWADSSFDFSTVKSLYFEDAAFDLSADFDDDITEKR